MARVFVTGDAGSLEARRRPAHGAHVIRRRGRRAREHRRAARTRSIGAPTRRDRNRPRRPAPTGPATTS